MPSTPPISAGQAGAVPEEDAPADASRQTLNSWLDGVLERAPVKVKPQKVAAIDDVSVRKAFSGDNIYGVSFATWPVAPKLPTPLSHQMVARVGKSGSVETIRDPESLRAFLAQSLTEVRGEAAARSAALASLRLAEAIASAGSFGFGEPEVSIARQGDGIVATAHAEARDPARGRVEIHLEFGADGRIKPDATTIDDQSRRGPPGGALRR